MPPHSSGVRVLEPRPRLREHIAVSMFVDHASCKEPREGTFGQVLGQPCCLTNLPRRQPVWMLAEQGDNDATAALYLRVPSSPLYRLHPRCFLLSLSPEPLEPCWVGRRVAHGMLNIPVPQVVLNEPRIRALVGEGEAAGVAEHVGVRAHG